MLNLSEKPLVSYVIGVRNMASTVGKTIESILNQDYPNKEIIVINDGSDDNTEEILKKFPIKYINTEKIGISNARNLGFKNSNGKFIAFTDADCELDSQWTKNILKGFENEDVGLVGGITQFRTDGTFSSIYRNIEFSKRYKNVRDDKVVWAGGPGCMFKRCVLEEIGGFNSKWIHGEDAEISFITIESGYEIKKINNALTYHLPESGFKKLIYKGYRDAKAYVRVTKNHAKISLRNVFNTKWYFPYDLILLPMLYLLIIISIIFYPLFLLFNIIILQNKLISLIIDIWLIIIITTIAFLILYSLIPSIKVALVSNSNPIKAFIASMILHHIRGFAWGLGLIIGIKNLIFSRD